MKNSPLRKIALSALALCFVASGWAARHFTASGSQPLLAIPQAFMAIGNGQAWSMSSQFQQELAIATSSGLYKLSDQGAQLRMTFAQPGLANSFANQYHDPHKPCVIEMAIDGRGYPSMELSTFRDFKGKISGANPAIAAPRSIASAFTIAHELGHCMLYAQAEGLPNQLVEKQAAKTIGQGLALSPAASKTAFHLFHESHSDAIALIALARRMTQTDFDAMAQLLLTRRQAAYLANSPDGRHDSHATFRIIALAQGMGWSALSKLEGEAARSAALDLASRGSVAAILDRPTSFGLSSENLKQAPQN